MPRWRHGKPPVVYSSFCHAERAPQPACRPIDLSLNGGDHGSDLGIVRRVIASNIRRRDDECGPERTRVGMF